LGYVMPITKIRFANPAELSPVVVAHDDVNFVQSGLWPRKLQTVGGLHSCTKFTKRPCVHFGQLRCGVHNNVNHAVNVSCLSGANITKSVLGPDALDCPNSFKVI
jgi:hypothetical protein